MPCQTDQNDQNSLGHDGELGYALTAGIALHLCLYLYGLPLPYGAFNIHYFGLLPPFTHSSTIEPKKTETKISLKNLHARCSPAIPTTSEPFLSVSITPSLLYPAEQSRANQILWAKNKWSEIPENKPEQHMENPQDKSAIPPNKSEQHMESKNK